MPTNKEKKNNENMTAKDSVKESEENEELLKELASEFHFRFCTQSTQIYSKL